ncbi:MAG: hypothetical protein PHR35_07815, partial [Kiritimatiellae bacterium]|nr:hypothetical protein [Kiritimatiellia bacterium]
ENGGVAVINGGAIGTNPALATAGVDVRAGGRFVMNGGLINYYQNYGAVALYGGQQTSSSSSENRGSLEIAGGDTGWQLVHLGGTVDVFYPYTNAPNWEIDAGGTNCTPMPVIRIYCDRSTLDFGEYTVAQLLEEGGTIPYPGLVLFKESVIQWTPWGSESTVIDLLIESNWNGRVVIADYVHPASPTNDIGAAVEVRWLGATGRTYQVQTCTNLVSADWKNLRLPVTGAVGTNYVLDTMHSPAKFYRVKLVH